MVDRRLAGQLEARLSVDTVSVTADMCAFGMQQEDEIGTALIKKPTAFMSNSKELLRRLTSEQISMLPHQMVSVELQYTWTTHSHQLPTMALQEEVEDLTHHQVQVLV